MRMYHAPLVATVIGLAVFTSGSHAAESERSNKADFAEVSVYVFDRKGELVGPVSTPRLVLSPAQWRKRLSPKQYRVLRASQTEDPFCGNLTDKEEPGVYSCAGCGLPLFSAGAKFHSGTGWPSFVRPLARENITTQPDFSDGTPRLEVCCTRCDGHLGHVFSDGPPPAGVRFCLNSAALSFTPDDQRATLADPAANERDLASPRDLKIAESNSTATAVFAAGCFWCTELVFEQLKGVVDVQSGYTGGTAATANYDQVHAGGTRHAEAVCVTFLPDIISYRQLLDVFFDAHDPTQLNRQGDVDVGRQYRSAIFYADERQKHEAQAKIDQLRAKRVFRRRIVTRLEPLVAFYPAEPFHQNFARKYFFEPYIQDHAVPRAKEVRSKHPDLIAPLR